MSLARNARRIEARKTRRQAHHVSPRAALDAYERHGCNRCGGKGSTSVAGLMPDGKIICRACLAPLEHRQAVSWLYGIAERSDGSEDDREWFAANPGKEWRLRAPLHMELDELASQQTYISLAHGFRATPADAVADTARRDTAIFTLQIEPGKRARIPCAPPEDEQELADWVEKVMLPSAREQAARSIPQNDNLTPEFRLLATNAVSITAMPIGPQFIAKAIAQGAAMREAEKAVKQ